MPLLLQLVILGVLAFLLIQADAQLKKENEARELVASANRLRRTLLDSSIALAGFAYTKSWGNEFRYNNTARYLPDRMKDLEEAAKHASTADKQRIDEIEKDTKEAVELFDRTKKQLAPLTADRVQYELRTMHKNFSDIMDHIDKQVAGLAASEEVIGEQSGASKEQSASSGEQSGSSQSGSLKKGKGSSDSAIQQAVVVVFAVSIILSGLTAYMLAMFFKNSIVARLQALTGNYTNLALSKPLSAPLSGDDEITDLDRSFRRMASALAEVHRKERAMIENAVDVICSIDGTGKFRAVSLASGKLWGYPADDLIGSHFAELIVPSQKEEVIEAFRKAMSPGTVLNLETQVRRRDHAEVAFSWSGCWSEADQSLFCVAHDITERKKVEKMKSDFVAMVSHDLRSPLSSISMFLSMLGSGALGEFPKNVLSKAQNTEKDAQRLINMVNDLLDVERMESGMFSADSMDVEPVYVLQAVKRSCESVEFLASKKQIKIDVSVREFLVMADESRLIQVLVNLLSNAIKFSPSGATVSVESVDAENELTINVRDNGPGISRADQERIFQRFERSESPEKRKAEGFGLGLAICKGIIEALGGTIGVTSDGATGSCFFVRLPKVPLD